MSLTLLDWRRRMSAIYAAVRRAENAVSAHELWRTGRDDLFRHHPDSPLPGPARAGFSGLTTAPYDPALRFEVEVDVDVDIDAGPLRIEVPTGTDGIVAFERVGRVRLGGLGHLDVWWLATYGGGLFVPVKDALAGTTTYGGGRYVIDTAKGADLGRADGWLVVDLNFAYNPSCAYDPAWACPLAPPGNVLTGPVLGGELMAPA